MKADESLNKLELLTTIIETTRSLIVVLDIEGRIKLFNKACEICTGFDRHEVFDFPFWEKLIPSDERHLFIDTFKSLPTEKQISGKFQNFWLTKNNEKRLIEWSNTIQFDFNGNIEYIIGTGIDITEQSYAEEQLKNSELRYRLISEISNEAIWDYDVLNKKVVYSSGYYKIFGIEYKPLGDSDKLWSFVVHPDDKQAAVSKFEEALNNPEVFTWKDEYRAFRMDGSIIYIQDKGKIIRDSTGTPIRMVGGMTDITAQKLYEKKLQDALESEIAFNRQLSEREEELASSEEELRQLNEQLFINNGILLQKESELEFSQEKFSKAFELSPDIIAMISEEDRIIVDISNAVEIILGYNRNQILGKSIKAFNHWLNEDERESFYAEYKKYGYAKKDTYFRRSNGELMYGVIYAKPITLGGKNHILIILRDITDRKKAEEEKAELNRMLGEYKLMALRSVMNPHFIFNSLNSIQYFVARNDKRKAIGYLSYFSKLIRGILNSSISKTIRLKEEIDLLRYYVEMELLRFSDKFSVSFIIDPEIDTENVEIPSLLIQPYVENAILHGLYNKEEKGLLEIAFKQKAQDLLIQVKDNGIGRKKAQLLKEESLLKHQPVGMKVTKERLDIINKESGISVEIVDLTDGVNPLGTEVNIVINV